ncbi:flagellar basal body L-ring protein FlgH [Pelagimonas varians]|uniref:Flagellar L-ring protein n=1 Tax=Pelagimonas varians TaxID=696760 RepID=A0A238KL08_9RHOB|nr:flagellar L-ring protein precursor FlgH [Pelagimonas varians]SMX42716.1 Flagellar L-ring protein precursor [Pelagimonas varians]
MLRIFCLLGLVLINSACARLDHLGKAPSFTPPAESPERVAMIASGVYNVAPLQRQSEAASLWSSGKTSLLGDRRAVQRGDIMTVVIEIDESAEISNETDRSRSGSEDMSVPQLFGVPQRINKELPTGASLDPAVELDSSSKSKGSGSVKRSETLTLRVAATVTDVLPNGILAIEGIQEVRVNFEMRELLVSGYVRPEDISRQNEITYDKIASARISYGGRGQISDMQQPRIGQQVLDVVLPF